MVSLLARLFIKNRDDVADPAVRTAYGTLCGGVGIFLNFVLFLTKLIAGIVTSSISVMADAFNNLSDAGSSVITLIGFRLAGQRPDPEHPFGHGRIEYVSGLIVSLIIIAMGFELGQSSIEKIISPEPVEYTTFAFAALVFSILVKTYMYHYNTSIGKKLGSAAMSATAMDSLSDTISTAVVLACAVISKFTSWQIDGWAGVVVALFICITGVRAARETINPLLGEQPDADYIKHIEDIVLAHPEVIGVHDLIVHNYGPGRQFVSLHAEVPSDSDLMATHDAIDNIERELNADLGCLVTIHMDPVNNNDEAVNQVKEQVEELVRSIDPVITLHDFRMVSGPTHTNVIFDVVVPYRFALSDQELKKTISEKITQLDGNYFAVINVDKSFTSPESIEK